MRVTSYWIELLSNGDVELILEGVGPRGANRRIKVVVPRVIWASLHARYHEREREKEEELLSFGEEKKFELNL